MKTLKRAQAVVVSFVVVVTLVAFTNASFVRGAVLQSQEGLQSPTTIFAIPSAKELQQLVALIALYPDRLFA